jgi:FtsP/CotA-like multicopper oxidase with cupredoxin domain
MPSFPRLKPILAVSLFALLSASCTEKEPLPDDSLPAVLGVAPAEDLDPAVGVVEYSLRVSDTDLELVEGLTTEAWTFNGTSPGPLLQARVGDLIKVHVTNDLDESTTVHWHGMRVPVEMDGVVWGELQAIEPGTTFTYEFIAPDAGSYWYHPHIRSKVQVEAGLYGPIVIHEREEEQPDVDADRYFVLDDIRLDSDGSISPHGTSHPDQMHGRSGNVFLVNGEERAPRVHLAAGAVERWRLVNAANARTMTLRFEGLEVREIGADGGLWPQDWTRSVEQIVLPVGARADLEVRLADPDEDGEMALVVLALNSVGNVYEDEIKLVPVRFDEDAEASTHAGYTADPEPVLPDATHGDEEQHEIEFDAYQTSSGVVWTMNGYSWPEYDEWSVDVGEQQVIRINNPLGPEHPFHLHGQLFSVLSRNGQPADEPGLRDTVRVTGQSEVVIAVEFTNPGTWMYHCHILEHSDLGMMALVEVD